MIPRASTDFIVVHATMTAERPTLQEITYRARTYGYLDVGMHYVIDERGLVTACRPDRLIGTGCRPHNGTALSILLTGSPPFEEDQLVALRATLKVVLFDYPSAVITGYRDLPGVRNNDSPGFDVKAWWSKEQPT